MKSRLKLLVLNIVDAALLNLAALASLALRFDGDIPPAYLYALLGASPVYTFWILFLLNVTGVNRSLWRYAGVPTLLAMVRTLTVGFGVLYLVSLLPAENIFPKSVVILTWVLSTGLILASRVLWKAQRIRPGRRQRAGESRILIAGAGDVGAMVASELLRGDHYPGVPVGFVDDDQMKRGRRVETLEVLGTTFDIPRLIREKNIQEVIIAAPSAPARLVRQIVSLCQDAGVTCRTVPALSDFIANRDPLGQVRDVQIEDLLGREPVVIDNAGIDRRIHGRTVMVTGAGGSIGSELCRQICRFHPGKLVAVDHCENRLTFLGLDLAESHPELSVLHVVGDVRDDLGMAELFREYKPEIVFHAAAHKHVNFLERSPREAILNNIMGTRNVARAASENGVETFVFISTDKAVNPSSVMGATKRAGEILLQAMAPKTNTTFVAVRFGNVLGSDGSVIPIFRRQLLKGGPLTVTHPDARRYFMTIPEASQLVIQAALLGESGDVFVLDMGEPVRIKDVAEQLIRLSGLRPGIDISIRYVGLRPGEKMEEELLTDSERARVTRHSKIFRWELDEVNPERVEKLVDSLIRLAHHAAAEEIRRSLQELVPEYQVRALAPLPSAAAEVSTAGTSPAAAISLEKRTRSAEFAVAKIDPRWKRWLDVPISVTMLVGLLPVLGVTLLLHQLTGAGQVRVVREERIGRNRRQGDRRGDRNAAPIDRRSKDRRQRQLPGPPFVTYRFESAGAPRNGFQRAVAGFLQRYRLDRVLYLWNVARGEMSLVGPSARLMHEQSFSQDWAAMRVYSRRPGLIGPGAVFTNGNGTDPRLPELYDRYYSRFGGLRLEIETLLRSVPKILRGEEVIPGADPGRDLPSDPGGELAEHPGGEKQGNAR
ncbi:MAG: polysaccharide biosynthesis protein [Candidatus Eisenbacteria bacterium]|nr:polysaccharide biosynthesis protein [Candidatus Eisenbacteria bacterium]